MTETNSTPKTAPAVSALPKCPFKWVYGRETHGSDQVVSKAHNDALAKLIAKNLKKDLAKVESQRQGYKGTGSKSYKRQIFLRSTTGEAVDVWLDDGRVEVGGVHVNAGSTAFRVADRTPEESYKELVVLLRTRGF